jgi:pimeloyl-ACP methyl ester carboxylesterase
VVTASDGLRLHVEIDGPEDAPLTVIFCHGVTLNLTSWREQRDMLAGSSVRRVFYDHRCHGLSGRCPAAAISARRLGQDLHAVIEAVAPRGPLVLVGHSLGGITIMALAGLRPELFGARVKGAVLVNTTSGGLDQTTFGLPPKVARLIHDHLERFVSLGPRLELVRAAGLAPYLLLARAGCHPSASREVRRITAALMSATPLEVAGEFIEKIRPFNERISLAALGRVRTVVLAGDSDILMPPPHAAVLGQEIPGATVVTVPHCGHMLPLEHPQIVGRHVAEMIASLM